MSDHYFHSLGYLAAGIEYKDLADHLKGYESVADDPILTDVFDNNYSTLSGCSDLIGYGSGSNSSGNIITRYNN